MAYLHGWQSIVDIIGMYVTLGRAFQEELYLLISCGVLTGYVSFSLPLLKLCTEAHLVLRKHGW